MLGTFLADRGILAESVGDKAKTLTAQVQNALRKNTPPPEPEVPKVDPIGPVGELQAHAVIAYDISNDVVLYEKNSNDKLPLASITKLMTALITAEHTRSDDLISISRDSLNEYGDSSLFAGEQWKAQDILDFMLMTSSNDAASALSKHVGSIHVKENEDPRAIFIDMMNQRADGLSLNNTQFIDETGLDANATTPGAYGSAHDVALLLSHIAKKRPALIEATIKPFATFTSVTGVTHAARNTNEAIPSIPALIGGKTGFTDLAGGNLAIIFDRSINEPVAVVVLGSTKEARFVDVQEIVRALQK
ncbi:MAG: hypothetical protein RI911_138 [Candidatus Parcubacteria bacterium]